MARKGGAPENMHPPTTRQEAQQRGHNGGIKSGESRRRKRDMRSATRLLMDLPVAFGSASEAMRKMGIDDDEMTNQMAMLVSMFKQSLEGNVGAAKFLRETAGTGAPEMIAEKKLKLEREKLELEKQRYSDASSENGESMPTIVDARPDRETDE